nr:tumor necrosis factor ligand superfamily member 6-like [Lytechinus pictus]
MWRWMHQMPPYFHWNLQNPPLSQQVTPMIASTTTSQPAQPSAPPTPLLPPQPPPPPPPAIPLKLAVADGGDSEETTSIFQRLEFIISISVISAVIIILVVVAVVLAIVARRRKLEAERRTKRMQMKRASSAHRSFHMTCLHNDMYRFKPDPEEIKSNTI